MRLHHQLLNFSRTSEGQEDFKLGASMAPTHVGLELHFSIAGPLERLLLPKPEPQPLFRDELWKSTCLEIFLQWRGESGYEEWNFSPSGAWAHYGFREYRLRDPNFAGVPLQAAIRTRVLPEELTLDVSIPWPHRSIKAPLPHCLRYGFSAVLEVRGEAERQYWATHHAGLKPDFHDERSFIGELFEDFLPSKT